MSVKKIKGTKVLKKVKKPYPEVREVKVMELPLAINYLDQVHPGIGLVLIDYWKKNDYLTYEDEEVYLPLPEEGEELEDLTYLVLEEYPEWEDIIFQIPEVDNG